MELNIEQILQQGIAAHKSGKLQEAERLYRTILKSQPLHPDANHNLGVLALSINMADKALPFFKTAIEINPNVEQFWVSYIKAHIYLKNFDIAQKVIKERKKLGLFSKNLNILEAELSSIIQTNETKVIKKDKKLTFSEKRKKDIEKKKKLKKKKSRDASPSKIELNNLSKHFQNKRFSDAEKLAITITEKFPKHPVAWGILGAVLANTGRTSEALSATQTAVNLSPLDPAGHNNLGINLLELGRLEESEVSLRKAIEYKPDLSDAHNALGNTLKEMKKFDDAEASYKKSIEYNSDNVFAHTNLGIMLLELNRLEEAEELLRKAIKLNPGNSKAKHMLSSLLGETTEYAPYDHVEDLFDGFAAKFDNLLSVDLEYRTPNLIADIIKKDSKFDSLGSVMDLGCGTGLLGLEIKKYCKYLEGIDLSQKMLLQAKNKNIYNKLVKQDILDYLSNENLDFDYFIATDVFVYLGNLSDIFRLIKSRNKRSGKFVFSTEHNNGENFFLEKSGRYSHSKNYIESLCDKFEYKLNIFKLNNLRKERNDYIKGGLYLLEF